MAEYKLTGDTDHLVGLDDDDAFTVFGSFNSLRSADIVVGGGGSDILRFAGITGRIELGPERLIGASSIETIDVSGVSGGISLTLDARTIGQAEGGQLNVVFGSYAMTFGITSMNAGDSVVLAGTGQVSLRHLNDQTIKIADGFNGNVVGGIGNDTVTGGSGNDTLKGGVGRDTLTGGAGNDVLDGGAGVDLIVSGHGLDTVTGGTEADLFRVGPGSTTITDFAVDFHLERIDLREIASATAFSKLAVTQTEAGALIAVADTTILLNGVAAADVSAGNFIFSGQTDTSTVLVTAGTSQAIIQRLIDEAPAGTTIKLDAGIFEFDKTLRIDRSDISFEGSGSDKTIIRSLISDANAGSTIKVQGALANQKFATVATTAVEGSRTIELTSTSNLKVGDVFYIAQSNDAAYFAETGNTGIVLPDPSDPNGSPLRESLSRVVAIDGNTITLADPLPYTFEAAKGWAGQPSFLKNVEVGGFRIETPFAAADPLNFENTREAWLGIATVSFRGVIDSKIHDVGLYNNASSAFAFTRTYGMVADHLTTVGSQNKGGGGNGYAWALSETFAGTFTHLTDQDMRHGVLFAAWEAEHYNNIQIDFTNRDINFHGSADSNNVIQVDRSVASYDPDGAASPSVGPGSFPQHPRSTIEDNDVRFSYLRATKRDETVYAAQTGGDIDTGDGHDEIHGGRSADLLSGGDGNDDIWGGAGNDRLFGGAGGDVIKGGADADVLSGDDSADILDGEAGFDTLFGGAGDDLLYLGTGDAGTGGAGSDTYVVTGNATITDYAVADSLERIDLRAIKEATSFAALKIAQVGSDTSVAVGAVTLILKNVKVGALTANDFVFVGDRTTTIAQMHTKMPNVRSESGAEYYEGTAGNDLIATTAPQLATRTVVKGGDGIDTLRLESDKIAVNAASFTRLSSVEVLDVSVATEGIEVQVGAVGVNQADGKRLTIFGGSQDIALDTSAVGKAGTVVVETFGTVNLRQNVNNAVTVSDVVDGRVAGSTGRDSITGGARADTLSGGDGDDVIVGGAGKDVIDGGLGDDVLAGGLGLDTINGGAGCDILKLEGWDVATGGAGSDTYVVTGNAAITDFAVADRMEKIDLRALASATSFAALKIAQVGADVRVVVGGVTLVLKNVAASKLTADHFVFVGDKAPTLAELYTQTPNGILTGGADRLVGTAGDDVFEGSGPSFNTNDTIAGGAGTDTLRFTSGTFARNDATLARLSSVEVIDVTQTSGVATFQVGAAGVGQADGDRLTILGGMRDIALDTSAVGKAGTVVVETFGTVNLRQSVNNAVTVSDLVDGRVAGSTGRDGITGGARADTLSGGDGDDVIVGGAGKDVIDGGLGNDMLAGGLGLDTINGGAGNDILRLEGWDVATGGAGSDTYVVIGNAAITDFAVADRMEKIDLRALASATSFAALKIAQVGADARMVVGGATLVLKNVAASKLTADNFIFFGDKAPTLAQQHSVAALGMLTGGADRLVGTAGDDVFEGSGPSFNTNDTIAGGAGTDTLRLTSGTFARNDATLARLSSVEVIDVTQTSGVATFQVGAAGVGQADGDRLTILGGTKDIALDTSAVGKAGTVVVETFGTVNLRQSVNNAVTVSDLVDGRVVGSTGRDSITGGARADTLSGGDGDDVIVGGAGNDRIEGGAGDDILTGGAGRDTLLGGLGNDVLRLEGGDVATGGAGSDTFAILGNATVTDFSVADRMEKIDLRGIATATSLAALEITQVGADAKVVVGGATVVLKGVSAAQLTADNFVFAGQAAQTVAELHSKVSAGLLTGAADRLVGTAGDDVFEGSGASFTSADTIEGGTGTDTLSITSGTFARTDATLARLSSVEIIDVSKTDGTAVFQVGAAGVGQADGDRLTLLGGTKDMLVDTGSVGKAGTVVVETFGTVNLRQNANNVVTVSNAVDGKVVGSNGNDTVEGGARADALTGADGHDILIGNDGADRLSGDAGNDVLTGGAGADTFVFASRFSGSNIDHITDFASADTIQLAKGIFTALAPGQLASAAFKDLGVAGANLDDDDRIVYNHDTGVLAYDADGAGKAAAVTFAVLDNKALLTHADVFVA